MDSDAHVVEPDSLWDNYLESKYKGRIKSHLAYERATKPTDPWTINVSVEVDDFPPQPMRRAKNEKEETDSETPQEAVGAEVFTMGVEEYYGKVAGAGIRRRDLQAGHGPVGHRPDDSLPHRRPVVHVQPRHGA